MKRNVFIFILIAALLTMSNYAISQAGKSTPGAFQSQIEKNAEINLAKRADWALIMSEDFESTFPSGLWTVDTLPSAMNQTVDARWAASTCNPYTGSYSAGCVAGGAASVSCGANYPNNVNTYMSYGPFDLSDASDAYMNFYWWSISEEGWDYFKVAASTNGTDFWDVSWSGYDSIWSQYTFDLTAVPILGDLTGEPQVWIAFIFTSDFVINWPHGAYVDDVELWKDVSAGPADLALTGGTYSPSPVVEDGSLAIAPQIINNGDSEATDAEIQYYLSSNTTITQSDCYLGSDSVTLGPGATGLESILVNLGNVGCVAPGTYYVGIYFVDENNGENFPTPLIINSATGSENLTLSGGMYSPNPVFEDSTLVIEPQISNIGSESATFSKIEYYLSSNTTISRTDCYLGNDSVTLGPGESITKNLTVDLSSVGCVAPGTYYVGIYFINDADGEHFPEPLVINSSGVYQDLTLSGGDFSPNPVFSNGTLFINPEITNNGTGAATGSEIEYYLSVNSAITQSDCYLGSDSITLGPGENSMESFSVDLNTIFCADTGSYYVGVYFVDEFEGEDFTTPLIIDSIPGSGDFSLMGGNCTPNPVDENGTLSIYPLITYTGSETITASGIQYYLSDDLFISPADCYLGNGYITIDSGQVISESHIVDLDTVDCVSNGTYYAGVYFTDEATGFHISNPLVVDSLPLSLTDNDSEINIEIYPNPVKHILSVRSYMDNETDIALTIYNNLGDIVYSNSIENVKPGDEKELDISILDKGIYFLQLRNKRMIRIEKLIKQ